MTLHHEPDPGVGAWIGALLAAPAASGITVTQIVPRGFAAYARVLHRLETPDPAAPPPREAVACGVEPVPWLPARWADAAAAHGTTLHPRAQLWRLLRLDDPGGQADDWSAPLGQLDRWQLPVVLDVLAAHTDAGTDAEVVVALWEGFGWIHGGGAVVSVTVGPEGVTRTELPPGFPPEVLAAPRLELPDRAYLLFRGPLGAVLPWCTEGDRGFWGQTPNLLWPADRTWCLASEIDLDSTVVGGSRALVDALCAHPGLEAVEVGPDDALGADADDVNRP